MGGKRPRLKAGAGAGGQLVYEDERASQAIIAMDHGWRTLCHCDP